VKRVDPRIAPVAREDWDEEVLRSLGRLVERPRVDNVFTTFARHPDLLRRWRVFAAHVLFKSELPPVDRELIILRIGFRNRCEYEFAQHAREARTLGMGPDDIQQLLGDPATALLPEQSRLLLSAVDELFDASIISDSTWSALSAFYNDRQMMDLVFTAGAYNLVSWALNSFGVEPDPELEIMPFLDAPEVVMTEPLAAMAESVAALELNLTPPGVVRHGKPDVLDSLASRGVAMSVTKLAADEGGSSATLLAGGERNKLKLSGENR
jgi:4-carboxymuconolactone decarboxylase